MPEEIASDPKETQETSSAHIDPLSGEPGAHPIGTSLGAATGGMTGAAIGLGGGPVGVVIGTVVGALIGGYAGKGVAEGIDPTKEEAYWRENHSSQWYAAEGGEYEAYAKGYRTGYVGFHRGKSFDEREAELQMEYEGDPQPTEAQTRMDIVEEASRQMKSTLQWQQARHAARAAYERLEREQHRTQGDPDPLPPNPGQVG